MAKGIYDSRYVIMGGDDITKPERLLHTHKFYAYNQAIEELAQDFTRGVPKEFRYIFICFVLPKDVIPENYLHITMDDGYTYAFTISKCIDTRPEGHMLLDQQREREAAEKAAHKNYMRTAAMTPTDEEIAASNEGARVLRWMLQMGVLNYDTPFVFTMGVKAFSPCHVAESILDDIKRLNQSKSMHVVLNSEYAHEAHKREMESHMKLMAELNIKAYRLAVAVEHRLHGKVCLTMDHGRLKEDWQKKYQDHMEKENG